jgi:hypothetical protein
MKFSYVYRSIDDDGVECDMCACVCVLLMFYVKLQSELPHTHASSVRLL